MARGLYAEACFCFRRALAFAGDWKQERDILRHRPAIKHQRLGRLRMRYTLMLPERIRLRERSKGRGSSAGNSRAGEQDHSMNPYADGKEDSRLAGPSRSCGKHILSFSAGERSPY